MTLKCFHPDWGWCICLWGGQGYFEGRRAFHPYSDDQGRCAFGQRWRLGVIKPRFSPTGWLFGEAKNAAGRKPEDQRGNRMKQAGLGLKCWSVLSIVSVVKVCCATVVLVVRYRDHWLMQTENRGDMKRWNSNCLLYPVLLGGATAAFNVRNGHDVESFAHHWGENDHWSEGTKS